MSTPVADRGRGPGPECLAPHAVRSRAEAAPGAVALHHVDGARVTYGQLDEEARRWAATLAGLGAGPGTIVATLLPHGVEAFAVWLGLGWLRAVEAPLNPALSGPLLTHALASTGTTLLVTTTAGLSPVAEVVDSLPALRRILLAGDGGPAQAERDGEAVRRLRQASVEVVDLVDVRAGPAAPGGLEGPRPEDVGALLFTSGTTGPAKGVLVTWAAIYQTWSWAPADALSAGEGLYCPFPMFHTSGKSALNAALVRGGRYVWRDRFSTHQLWDDVRAADCTTACLVGPMLSYVHGQPPTSDDGDNPLRAVLCGPMIPEIEAFEARFAVRVATCYSMTEVGTPLATGWDHGPSTTCGRARTDYPWAEVQVVDGDDEPLGPGQVGELVVRSPEPWALNAGYHGLPEATANAWRNGWFHTGDAFRYDDDGWFTLVDRMKDAIRRKGENVSSFDVEAIVRTHPAVIDCAAVGVPGDHGDQEVLIVVELGAARGPAAEDLDPATLSAWLRPRVPGYMWPRFIRLVPALPRNETSLRVQKFRLRAEGVTPGTWDRSTGCAPGAATDEGTGDDHRTR